MQPPEEDIASPLAASEAKQSGPLPVPTPALNATARASLADAVIAQRIDVVRTRLLWRARLERARIAASTFVGGAIVLATLRALTPAFDLRAALVPTLLGGLYALWLAGRARRRSLDASGVAAALHDATRTPIADELRSLLQLQDARAQGRLGSGDAFLVLLGERVAQELTKLDLEVALPVIAARIALRRTLLICSLALLATQLVAPWLWKNAWAALRQGAPLEAAIAPAPIVGDLELELTPPPYTGLPARTLPSSGGELRVLRGTKVHVRARSLGRALRAELLLELDGQKARRVPVTVSSNTAAAPLLETDFIVDAPGKYRFVLWRWTGRIVEPEAHRIELDPDLPPRVELRVPADPLELQVPRPIELGIDAEDDFGIGAVSLVWQINDGKLEKKALTLDQPTPRRARGRFTWETGELERDAPLPPGAKITYYIEAEDNDAVSGKKLGRSRAATILMRAVQKPAELDRVALEGLMEATLTHLADRLEHVKSPEPHGALVSLLAQYQKILHGAAGTPALKKVVVDAAARLDKLAAEESQHGAATYDAIVAELERDVLALDDLRAKRRLDEMVRVGDEMKRARDELTRLMNELKTATSEQQKAMLKQEIERKLVELEAKMAELRRAASDAEGEVPDEFLNRDALKKQEMHNQTDSIRQMLAQGNLDKAMSELDRMSRSLDQLTGSLEKSQHAQHASADPEQERSMSALENDLADLAKEEHEVESQARAVRDSAASQHGNDLKALRDKLRPKLAELDRRADEEAHEARLFDRDEIDRLRHRAKSIDRALEAEDLDEAQQMAQDTRKMAQGTAYQLHLIVQEEEAEAQARVGDGPSAATRKAEHHAGEVETLAKEIEAELNKSDPQKTQLSNDAKQRLDELARRQQGLQQKSDALQKRMGQERGLQGMPQGVGQKLGAAREQMGEAKRQLQRPAPGRGADAAQEAAEQLDAARKQVSQARKGGEDGEQSSASPERDQPVRIPGADDSAAPRAFREELLDAMKRGAPKRFEEQVQHFYEELVR